MRAGFLLVVAAVVSLGTLEVAIRALDLFGEARRSVLVREDAQVPGAEAPSDKQLHPLRGWTRRPNAPPKPGSRQRRHFNLFGFFSGIHDYRTVSGRDFVIGIFGGSVAEGVATKGAAALEETLARARPELASSIRILNFAFGAYKQPQQLAVLSEMVLLGVPLDFVVNLDGLNEVALGRRDVLAGHHPLFPSRPQMEALVDFARGAPSDAVLETSAEIAREQRAARRIPFFLDASGLARSELARAVGGALATRHRRRAAELEAELHAVVAQSADAGVVASIPDPCLATKAGCQPLIADIWARASALMAAQAASVGAGYLHALQPSQYVPGSKRLTRSERQRAHNLRSVWAISVRKGYPLLLERGAQGQAQGIDFLDLTGAFRSVDETVYIDICCHTNRMGYRIMAELIGVRIAAAIGEVSSDGSEGSL